MLKSVLRSVIGITLIFAVACEARAEDDVQVIVDPDESVAGHTQLFWAQTWWQWVLSIPDTAPQAPNPNNDPTGASAAIGNTGPVFFLAGVGGSGGPGGSASRTITVPYGKPVFFPVANVFFAAVGGSGNFDPTPCPKPLTLSCALGLIRDPISKATNMMVQIDNKILNTMTHPNIKMFRHTSTSFFTVTLPPSNVFGLPPSMYFPNNPVWVQDGYYVMLNNLSLGTHHLHFHGEIPPIPILGLPKFTGDVTDTLNVVVAP
jgi:hypothetical protein